MAPSKTSRPVPRTADPMGDSDPDGSGWIWMNLDGGFLFHLFIYLLMFLYFWVNYNEVTTSSLEIIYS